MGLPCIDSQYNADRQVLTIRIKTGYFYGDYGDTNVEIRRWVISDKQVMVRLGTDIVLPVNESESSLYLHFTNRFDFLKKDKPTIELGVAADQAKMTKANLRILFLYRLVSPFFGGKPLHKVDDVSFRQYSYLAVDIEQMWFYNFDTGEIYKKIKSKSQDDGPKVAAEAEKKRRAAAGTTEAEKKRLAEIDAAKWRTWTDKSGTVTVHAKFGGLVSKKVKLIKDDGSEVRVWLENLSEEDQEWVKNRKR